METYEFEGKTDQDAIENACRQLNLKKDQMDIVILEPGSAGIFGLVGGRKAKIKVTIKPKQPEPVEEISKEKTPEPKAASKATASAPEPADGAPDAVPDDRENEIAIAKEALENILALIPMEGITVTGKIADGSINLNIEGDKTGLLIGRKGKTLDALQFIVNKIVNKTLEKRSRVIIDSENYRLRRQEFLVQMALKMGDKAKKIKRPVATNLLNPHDRRIVHLALRDDDELGTKGKGDGILKKVVIIPRKQSGSRASRAQ
ncbi:MAG: Jag N-terminal domain-containing protein [Deltaproteobacteria bacterium]|nr:Jag N-terminal domain-containing protein [Deltaproteobacteria bacterium]